MNEIDPFDEDPNKNNREQEQKLRERQNSDIRKIISTPEGERLYRLIFEVTGAYGRSYVPGDSHATAFNEGMKNVGLIFASYLNQASSKAYLKMTLNYISELKSKKE